MTEIRPRARKGTGHTFQRGSVWYCQWSSHDPATGGRRQHKKGGFRSERDARRFLTAEIGKVDNGTFIAPPKPKLLGEMLDAWLTTKTEIRATTREGYDVAVNNWLKPRLGGTKLSALTEDHVRKAVAELSTSGGKRGKPLSARSCQLALVVLRMAISWAMDQGWAVRNPALKVKVKRTRPTMKTWTPEQARRFLAAIRDDRLAALYALGLARGLRRGELAGLRWSRVDLDAGSMSIVETQVLVGGHATASTPKTAAGVRRIGLDPSLVDVLRAHRRRQLADRLAAGPAWTDSGYVFTDELGLPVKPDHISDRFAKLCAEAAVPVIRLHDTRHTAATLMLAAGIATKVVAEILGHADTRITTETYQHVLPGMADDAGAMLSSMVL